MSNLIERLQRQDLVWQGSGLIGRQQHSKALTATGYTELDKHLQGGFPKVGVVDLHTELGIGELRLLLPSLMQQNGLTAVINPPARLNADALQRIGMDTSKLLEITPGCPQEALWAAEQCLKSGACNSVLIWHGALQVHQVKRLQLAAQTGEACLYLLRREHQGEGTLPVSLSLGLSPHIKGLNITVKKRKGGWAQSQFALDMSLHWPELTEQFHTQSKPVPDVARQYFAGR
ncbi:translesion DNA synthesis-associated protein ImuA [Pseudoalteromonas sp. R3]|uniref:translesion DNA synthesis-associated protein ImuA n=1 Tax=Pseudoalteromonas sp. R3 TaxID=1709477 RepID=UPI0006B63030|nr:translesion DNA synthesis-associated protein ImuA [Pseudoalteromonas sp. R3]AZZ99058.1 translesion DNA synthesis-associated protein ImuA [Pseudoalteromonas sp. R3]